MDNRPIGVFDSGLGGLTVLKEIIKLLPHESVVYFGDSGRTPYGTKSRETITKYAIQNIRFLLTQNVKMVVIACNTVSSSGLEAIRKEFDIPIIEVVNPGAVTAVRETVNKKIGVIGTTATINSGIYKKAILAINKDVEVYGKECPMFVPLVEEGWWDNQITYMTAQEYLDGFKEKGIDTLVLGCTHYPLLYNTISNVLGKEIRIVSSALEVAKVVKNFISENEIMRKEEAKSTYRYYTSDSTQKFLELGSCILDREMKSVQKVEIEKY